MGAGLGWPSGFCLFPSRLDRDQVIFTWVFSVEKVEMLCSVLLWDLRLMWACALAV
jgi:hypothetical protein